MKVEPIVLMDYGLNFIEIKRNKSNFELKNSNTKVYFKGFFCE